MKKLLLLLALVGLGCITAVALWHDGFICILSSIGHSYGSIQIFTDLVIALTLVMVWMWRDARRSGRNVWPWILMTLVVGSFGPLLYLITARRKGPSTACDASKGWI